MSAQNDSIPSASAIPLASPPMASPIPVASAIVPMKKRPSKVKPVAGDAVAEVVVEAVAEVVAPKAVKPRAKKSAPVVLVDDDEEEAIADPSFMEESEVEVMIKQSEYKSLLARVEALESKKKSVRESAPRKSAVRIATKDIILRDIVWDGEEVFAKELINDGEDTGNYITWKAVFHSAHNGFLIDEADNERVWGVKRAYATSPTTLCSRFRYLMKEAGQCKRGASTCCGFAKCYVIRDGVPMKLNTLW